MKELTEEKRNFLKSALELKGYKEINGYVYIRKQIKGKFIEIKRSRAIMQLHLNKELEVWETVHHKNGDKSDDGIENLQVMTNSEHISLTHAGKRRKKDL